ncbi:hypothetical protein [Maricaulis sp.]|uniref:hypothetical protein n=1 Tax=Maricaulis sp. TaxID=1486257 RepID=UPI001B01D4FF|nr:hypothetical protein [Maricaulis sp.]MBO6765770.1 hypothetical protein [Maricaulis sp.]
MDIVSRRVAGLVSPNAVRPFWSEVAVHAAGAMLTLALCAAVTWRQSGTGSALPILLIFALPISATARTLIRNPIRHWLGLKRDIVPWWFKLGFIGWAPEKARSILPAWQVDGAGLYLPGLGDQIGIWLGTAAMLAVYWGVWHRFDGLGTLWPVILVVAAITLFFSIAYAMLWMRLPEPGKSRWSFW